eukprot:TRINITY_DN1696_c0_g1_i4.p1 TRINITY_DN1696_c0_g1~~TRINITY_DN1696_c0_g1_i4.p1  ORF type:complete len:424 (-),score=85.59 TRINITY_DN1696_c0_g1_i4:87-1358(-)
MSGIIHVNLLEASNLIAADRGGTSDPFARFAICRPHNRATYSQRNSKETSFKSKIIKKTLNPTWNEQFDVPSLFRDDILVIDLLDDDGVGRASDPLGSAFVPLLGIARNTNLDMWLNLEKVPHGKVHVIINLESPVDDPLSEYYEMERMSLAEGGEEILKELAMDALEDFAEDALMTCLTAAVATTAAAPVLPFVTAGLTAYGVYGSMVQAKDMYEKAMASDPSALMPIQGDFDLAGLDLVASTLQIPGSETACTLISAASKVQKVHSQRKAVAKKRPNFPPPIGLLEIKFGAAQNLKAMDLNMAGKATSSDPFCKIYLREGTGKAYRSWQTGLFAKNLNPVWTIPPWTMLYVANSTLTVSIFDKDFGRPDDFIGMVTIPLHALFERFGAQDGENEWTQCRFILCGEDGRENHRLGSLKFSFR